jgi:TonB-linked SusC/RagA family outer membrane protein
MRFKFTGLIALVFALFAPFAMMAQAINVSGTVTSSEDGLPMPGVSIIVVGSTNGTSTDFDGNYSIDANTGDKLHFSFIGYSGKTVTVSGSSINVVMSPDAAALDEIVVMGFASRKKSELTGSSVQISQDAISLVPVASVDQVLQGKVAGLTITGTSGTPGSEQNVRIRGVSSITAGNEPLYVIDGVPVSNANLAGDGSGSSLSPLSSINSSNIASVTVLKDASATAPYGARGANGVIVITTKSGKQGKTKFNFSASVGFSNDAVEGPTMLTAAEQEVLFNEAVWNTYGSDGGAGYIPTIGDVPKFVEANITDEWKVWNDNGRKEGNWSDVIKNKNALQQDYTLSATGGDENSNFYASLGYLKSEATVIGSDFQRISAVLNYSRNLTDKIKLSTTNTISNSVQDGLLEQSAYYSSPRMARFFFSNRVQPYNDDGTINIESPDLPGNNPLYIAENDINLNKLTRILSNNSINWEMPVENLFFTTRVAIDYQVNDYKTYQNRIHGDGATTDGYASRLNRNITNYIFQNSFDYSYSTGENKFDFRLQHEFQKNAYYRMFADGEKFAADGLSNLDNAGNPLSVGSSYTDWAIASLTGMVNYMYSDKYILNATYRREGNSRFSEDNRWGNFWSVGAAWNMHRESFLEGSDIISNLKLRASYGKTGNANIGLNQYQVMLGFDANYAGQAAVYPSGYGNSDLTWETQNTLDVGVDYGFLDNRIYGSFSYYNRVSNDLLLDVPLSRTTGFSSQTSNIGSMWNKGIEFELNYDIIRSNDLNLSIGGYVATTNNEVTELAKDTEGNPRTITTRTRKVDEGHAVYEYYLVKFAGVDEQTGVNTYYLNGKDGATTTVFSEAERAFQGTSALPTITAGMNVHVDFKGFFFDANGYYAGGHQVYEGWHRYIHGSDIFNTWWFNSINTLNDRWQKPGDVTNVEKVTFTAKPWERHTNYLHDGDYFRLKNVTFGYDFKGSYMQKIGIENARLFVRGTNVLTWVKDKDLLYDPEVDPSGSTGLTTPAVKTYSFGVNINF